MKKPITVSQINTYIKHLLKDDVILSDIFVVGEVSNYKRHFSGHMYFTLKDDEGIISCCMFKNSATNLKFALQNGMQVIVYGHIGLYEKSGTYQIYVELIEPEGKGALQISFEQLKEKLQQEGFFDKKRDLPKKPETIALLTSPTGAVIQDMISTTKRLDKTINLVIVPTIVQGSDAVQSIINSIKNVNKQKGIDIIVLARGGGTTEDLWPFNDEEVARAIKGSKIPTISAIGHETDYTIVDFVADVRASTPTAAIEMALQNRPNQVSHIAALTKRLTKVFDDIYDRQTLVFGLQEKLNNTTNIFMEKEQIKIGFLITSLNHLSPLNIMERGFCVVQKEGKTITSIADIKKNDELIITLKDGRRGVVCQEES